MSDAIRRRHRESRGSSSTDADRRKVDPNQRDANGVAVDEADADQRDPAELDADEVDPAELDVDELDPAELVRTENGELMHEESGLIVDETVIDHGPEWRAFNSQERQQRSRVGSPLTKTRHDEGLTTEIGWRNRDAHGQSLSSEKRQQMRRLRTWQQRIRTQDAGERNLQFALSEVARMTSALDVPKSVKEVASVIYRRALDEDLIRGRSIEGVATASLYAAARQQGLPRSLDEVAAVSRVDRAEIGRAYRYLSQELGLELEPVDPTQYVSRYCSELGLDQEVRRKAEHVLDHATSEGLHAGKSPSGYAAAAVYLAALLCDCKRTQKDVADVADVTEVTVRNGYQEQMELIGTLN